MTLNFWGDILKKKMFVLLLSALVLLCGCDNTIDLNIVPEEHKQAVLDIMVTNKCLYTMVKEIAGQNNNVDYMFKDENKIDDFVYTNDSISNIGKQDLFIYNGADFEKWIDEFLSKLDKSKVGVINVSRGVSLQTYVNKNNNNSNDKNPYYWGDSNNYKVMLLNIKNAIEEKDPKNRNTYEENFSNAIKSINKYKKSVDEIKSKLDKYTFVTSNYKFAYLLKDYDSIQLETDILGDVTDDYTSKIQKKADDGKQLCFVYNDDTELQKNKDIIDKFKMKTVKFTVYDGDMSYLDILNSNLNNIKKVLQ